MHTVGASANGHSFLPFLQVILFLVLVLLDEIVRGGTRQMLAAALQDEITGWWFATATARPPRY